VSDRFPGQTRPQTGGGFATKLGRLSGLEFGLDSAGLAEDGGHYSRVRCAIPIQHKHPAKSGQCQHDSGVCKYSGVNISTWNVMFR
jgi:hypothetical protein